MRKRKPQLGEISSRRAYGEPDGDEIRTPFQRDRDRIIHCTAFRRLEYKTQVFVNYEGDHYRTRLTHSLEVAQIARSLVFAIGGDEPLAEALALAHDLGHPPFGHAGEEALRGVCSQFDHNRQTLKIVTELEDRYPSHPGLNLTHACLEGLLKHNYPNDSMSKEITGIEGLNFDPKSPPSLEAEMTAIADDIAYNCHDLDDGLRGDENQSFFALDDVAAAVPLVGEELRALKGKHSNAPNLIPLLISGLIGKMIRDLRRQTLRRIRTDSRLSFLRELKKENNAHLQAFSEPLREQLALLRGFLNQKLYKSCELARKAALSRELLTDLFHHYRQKGMPEDACDYIAGMTDRFAMQRHQKYFPKKESLRLELVTKI